MHRHGGVEVSLAGTHLHRDAYELDHFAGPLPDDVDAYYPVAERVDYELHQNPAVATRQGRLERPERGLVDIDAGQTFARLGLGETDGADLRLREHRGRNVGMVYGGRPVAEHRIRKSVALAYRDGSEIDSVGDIADRIDVRYRRARIRIDRDAAQRRRLDARLLDAEIGDVGLAAYREHDAIGIDLAAAGQRGGVARIAFLDRGDDLADDHLDAAHL